MHEAVRNHGLPSVSVSDVEVTRDMAHAKVFVTALQPEKAKEAMKALKALAPEIRYQLARAVKMRHVPELHFHYDDSVDKGERIDQLLREPARDDDAGRRGLTALTAPAEPEAAHEARSASWTASCCSTSRRG